MPCCRYAATGRHGRDSRPVEEPGLCGRGPHHAGARHWRHLGHLQRRQGRAAHAAAVRRSPNGACRSARKWISFDKTWLADQEVVDFRNMSKTMTAIAAWSSGQQNLTGDGEPVRVGVGFVTANTLRRARRAAAARPRRSPAEEDVPNGPQVAVLGYPLWQARYGGDPSVDRPHADAQRRAGRSRSASCRRASACRPTSPTKRRSRRSCGGRMQMET